MTFTTMDVDPMVVKVVARFPNSLSAADGSPPLHVGSNPEIDALVIAGYFEQTTRFLSSVYKGRFWSP